MTTPNEHRFVETNGIRLHVVQAGPEDGPLVLLLHGFPEFWYGWHRQIPALAAAGYRVWAPDQRGYGRSDKPRAVSAYRARELERDALGLIDAAGRERAHVVGHDWGGLVAWRLAARHPERVERVAILNAPHPGVMRREMLTNPRQALRSHYVFLFQLPLLPELVLGARSGRLLAGALRSTSRPGTFSREDLARYRQAWREPGALRGMINWYRAAVRGGGGGSAGGRGGTIEPAALLLWGTGDRFLGRELAERSIARCRDGRLEWLEGVSHWLQHEEPERVNALLDDFLRG
jgi:epoxide hydrolase 4